MSIAKGFGFGVGILYQIVSIFTVVLAIINVLAYISDVVTIVDYDAILIMISLGVLITQISRYFYK